MRQIFRRDFLFVSSEANAGSMLALGLANAANDLYDHCAESGLDAGQPTPLRRESILGLLKFLADDEPSLFAMGMTSRSAGSRNRKSFVC